MRFVKGLLIFLLVVVIGVALVAAGGYLYLMRRPMPQANGAVQSAGLNAPITIIRDNYGIPHIYASSAHDLFFAEGYVHAQDRLWQMEISRMGIAGRTSELSPSQSSLERDKFVRTLGFRRAAQADYDALDEGAKAILQAYADGVNAYMAAHESTLPSEFAIVGAFGSKGLSYRPDPWSPIDTLQIAKYMAWALGGNWEVEVFRAQLIARFGEEQASAMYADLVPPYDYKAMPVIVPAGVTWQDVPSHFAGADSLGPIAHLDNHDIGSNNWVISGSRTTTGKPLLANDPHLDIQMPSIWYFNSIHCQPVNAACPYDMTGAVFPGTPGIIIGHNARIAWGVTNVGPDVQDLFLEKITGNQYEYQGKQYAVTITPEVWTVKGKLPAGYRPSQSEVDTYDEATNTTKITLNVRSTRHGPIISDVNADTAKFTYPTAFSWTAINAPEQTLNAFLGIDAARNWDEFRAALSKFGSPSQNFVYADVDGNVGYQTPGRIPIRKSGSGQFPVPGWTGEYDWIGYIPFDELPRTYNPPQGYIATANNAVVEPGYKYFISMDWDRGYRARRIVDLINAKDKLSPADMAAIQGDAFNLSAQQIVPYLKNITVQGDAQKVLNAILGWDLVESRESIGAGAYEVFWLYLLHNTFDDKLGDLAPEYVNSGPANRQAIAQLLAQPDSKWWDNVNTPDVKETRDDILKKSLNDAARTLVTEYGSDPAGWQWGKLHTATFASQALGDSPVAFIFNRGPFPVGGSTALVDNTGTGDNFKEFYSNPPAKLSAIFAESTVPSLRQIVDLSDLNASRFIHTTGQSGLPASPHYDDMIPLWLNIQYIPMWWNLNDIKANAEGTLTLTP